MTLYVVALWGGAGRSVRHDHERREARGQRDDDCRRQERPDADHQDHPVLDGGYERDGLSADHAEPTHSDHAEQQSGCPSYGERELARERLWGGHYYRSPGRAPSAPRRARGSSVLRPTSTARR